MKRAPIIGLVLAAALAASAAWAISTKLITLESPHRLLALWTFHSGVKLGASGTTIPNSYAGSTTYDFPALGSGVLDLPCAESWSITTTGAAIGDPCQASSNHGADGGSVLPSNVTLSCSVTAADTTKAKLCVRFTDAGTYDSGDAGYYTRTLGR